MKERGQRGSRRKAILARKRSLDIQGSKRKLQKEEKEQGKTSTGGKFLLYLKIHLYIEGRTGLVLQGGWTRLKGGEGQFPRQSHSPIGSSYGEFLVKEKKRRTT